MKTSFARRAVSDGTFVYTHQDTNGCRLCGCYRWTHGTRRGPFVGVHQWVEPTKNEERARYLLRRGII